MRLDKILPVEPSDKFEILDYLRGDGKMVSEAYELFNDIKLSSNEYVTTPRALYGKDLGYVIKEIEITISLLKSTGFTDNEQIIILLSESLNYLSNRR